jgi:hypothetical protein
LLRQQENLRTFSESPLGQYLLREQQLKEQAAPQQEEHERLERVKQEQEREAQERYDRTHTLPGELIEKMIAHLKNEKDRRPNLPLWNHKTKIAGEGIVFLQKLGARVPDKQSRELVRITDKQTKTVIRILENGGLMAKLMS